MKSDRDVESIENKISVEDFDHFDSDRLMKKEYNVDDRLSIDDDERFPQV